jgi:vesicle-associated membrane protein 7
MVQNSERVLERGERIDLLVNKTDHMNQTAFAFRQRSTALRCVPLFRSWKLTIDGGCGGRILSCWS